MSILLGPSYIYFDHHDAILQRRYGRQLRAFFGQEFVRDPFIFVDSSR